MTDLHRTVKVDDASYHYYGTSLVQPQIAAIEDLPNDLFKQPVFFGRRDTSGVLGFIIPSQHSITVFHPLEDIHNGKPPVSIHSFASQCWDILDVHFSADAQIPMAFVSLKSHHDDPNSTGTVIEVNWHDFEKDVLGCRDNLFLSHQDEVCMNFGHKQRVKFPPTQLCNNIATLTAVDRSGQVYTYATDRRFSSAMGRDLHPPNEEDEDNQDVAWPVPFLGETVVKKIAAGGLYTAAVSEDGELHIWGQATTDMSGELLAIKNKEETGDEHVRTPDLQIGGQLARVTDVAVGFAYVLIAAEREGRAGIVERAVFAGGNNRHGSTGLGLEMKNMEFVEEFIPVSLHKGLYL